MRTTTRGRLQPLIESQHGLITTAQLVELGIDPRLSGREGWREVAPRTWSTQDGEPTDEQLVQAGSLYAGPSALASGALACRRHGLRDVPARAVADVLVSHGRRLTGGGNLAVHQTARMPKAVIRQGSRVAPAARSVADAARWCDNLADVRALVLAALDDVFVQPPDLLAEADAGQAHGRALLERALGDWHRGARSAPEAEAADALQGLPRRAGVPPFVLNPWLLLGGRLLGRPDGYVPGLGLGWEVDSLRHHGSSQNLADTLGRHDDFAGAGIELVHVVPAVLRRDPGAWARAFGARARLRAAQGGADPRGLVLHC